MREKLNNDPKTQVAFIGVLIVLVAFFFVTKSGGGEESEAEPVAEAPVAAEGSVEEAAPAEAAATSEPLAPSVDTTSIQAPPAPEPVRAAYKEDKTVVLLVVHDGGIDDKLVKRSVETLSGLENVVTFVVPASEIYRYAAITLGVEVSRVPALIVMRPKSLSNGTPQATVTFGFRSENSIVQAVRDAEYDGPAEAYHPG
jgi:hypothetical protein